MSTKVSRRYELPTCLLEIWTERSPLSEWQSQIVAQNLRFRLQLSSSKKIIKGNQQQITNLIESVTTYCDRWLAQDNFDSLDHAIAVPQLSKIKLSTLQLFDLYESLELCANEIVILPNVLLEVRRITPNWLKVMAAAIAIVGVSIGTIRLISREQPSYQVASTPAASSPEIAQKIVSESSPEKSVNTPSASSNSKLENNSKNDSSSNLKDTDSLKSPRQIPSSVNPAESKAARTSQADQGLNQVAKSRERTDKEAIAPEPIITGRVNTEQKNPTDQKSVNSPVQSPSSLESSSKDTFPSGAIAEASKPAAPSAKVAAPSTTSRAADSITTKIKVLQIQSELPSEITTDLVRYIQSQRITSFDSGNIALELDISGDRIRNISVNNQISTLRDGNAIAELEKVILSWRSANSATGKIYLVLQL